MVWYQKTKSKIGDNGTIYHIPPNAPWEPGTDGSYEQFKDYVDIVKKMDQMFDMVLIDGRARVDCARSVIPYLKEGAVVFLHDFIPERVYYHKVLDYYDLDQIINTLAVLKLKK